MISSAGSQAINTGHAGFGSCNNASHSGSQFHEPLFVKKRIRVTVEMLAQADDETIGHAGKQ
jgi:hypothetical protein